MHEIGKDFNQMEHLCSCVGDAGEVAILVRRRPETKALVAALSDERGSAMFSPKFEIEYPVSEAAREAMNQVYGALIEQQHMTDPKTKNSASETRDEFQRAFTEAGYDPIYMKAVPNEYYRDKFDSKRWPWFLVTTVDGTFKVGWRKRVINLDWSDTELKGNVDGNKLFAGDDTTRDELMVHCCSIDRLTEYLGRLRAAFRRPQ